VNGSEPLKILSDNKGTTRRLKRTAKALSLEAKKSCKGRDTRVVKGARTGVKLRKFIQ